MSLFALLAFFAQGPPHAADFLVVAPACWKGVLDPFLEARARELRTEFAPLEDALAAGAEGDPPERLKRFLYRAWRERSVRYALLVGDADTLPVRFMALDRVHAPAFHFAFYASDLYYADLADDAGAFDTWNAQQDDFHGRYFGEVRGEHDKAGPINLDRVSYRPEIAVGRWPVSDAEDLDAVVAKTLAQAAAAPPSALFVHAEG
jgi:hypothetical protein